MGRWTAPNMSPPLHLLHLPWQPGVDERIRGGADGCSSWSSLSSVYFFPLGLWQVYSGAGVGLAHLSRGKMYFKWLTDIWKSIINVRCVDTVVFCIKIRLCFSSCRAMWCWLCLCCCGNAMFPLSSRQPISRKQNRRARLHCKGCWDTWSLSVNDLL